MICPSSTLFLFIERMASLGYMAGASTFTCRKKNKLPIKDNFQISMGICIHGNDG
jgi:hypothetical protein